MNAHKQSTVRAHLESLANGASPEDKHEGVCLELRSKFGLTTRMVRTLCAGWPKASGDRDFPVPCPDGGDWSRHGPVSRELRTPAPVFR